MKKLFAFVLILALLGSSFYLGTVYRDRQMLRDGLIRLHVVANSDSEEDQAQKLAVRDAIISYLSPMLSTFSDKEEAKAFLESEIEQIRRIADDTLHSLGSAFSAVVAVTEEAFDTRHYDTFTLPAGIYSSLRVKIGEAAGKNWWCVVFPSLCTPTTTESFVDTSVSAGFGDRLSRTISNENGKEIRFFLLDVFGKIENKLFRA